jgi:dihydrofolate reductase
VSTQYYTATTLDGFIADPANSLEWLFTVPGEEGARDEFGGFYADVGAMVMGSTTYEWIVAHEDLLEHPEQWQSFYKDMPTWVFTSRDLPTIAGANLRMVSGDVRPVHAEMQAAAGRKNVWVVGGGDLAGQFADAGLLDEVLVSVAPVTLGGGAPLLPRRLLADRLQLTAVDRIGQFASLSYRVLPPAGSPG